MTTISTRSTTSASTLEEIVAASVAAALPGIVSAVIVAIGGTEQASQTEVVADPGTGATHVNAGGRLVYSDGPLKGKFAPTLTDAERAEKQAAGEAFVAARRERRAGKVSVAARKSSNSEMAAWLRELGFVPNGTVWALAKAGERSKTVLAKANAADAVARAAAKAALNA